ncbi:hypothetical protein DFJ74DRAFT_142770 [Hyaloraphidium curvatum]|nr:hypothetical protein DFJ74DRAFT_142770 [Hyaloraphidium curvatum]
MKQTRRLLCVFIRGSESSPPDAVTGQLSGCCCAPSDSRPVTKFRTITVTRTVTASARARGLAGRAWPAARGDASAEEPLANAAHSPNDPHDASPPERRAIVPNHLCPLCPAGARLAKPGTSRAAYCCPRRRTVTSTRRTTRTRTVTPAKRTTTRRPLQTISGRIYYDVSPSREYVPGVDRPLVGVSVAVSYPLARGKRAVVCRPALGSGATDASGLFRIVMPAEPAGTPLVLRLADCTVLALFVAPLGTAATVDGAISLPRTTSAMPWTGTSTSITAPATSSTAPATSSTARLMAGTDNAIEYLRMRFSAAALCGWEQLLTRP